MLKASRISSTAEHHPKYTNQGVAGIYNRFKYEKECREAINLWEERLQTLLALSRAA